MKKNGAGEKRVSIFDVAKRSDCSIATVSNVLNGKGRVGEKQRQAVLKAVKALGYVTDLSGRNLRLGRSEALGVLFYPSCAHIFRNPYYAEVMEALEREAYKQNYNLVLIGYEIANLHADFSSAILRSRVDGLVLVGECPTETIEKISVSRPPLVLLDTDADHLAVDSITSDAVTPCRNLIAHLAEQGHSRIIMAAYKRKNYNIEMRIRGFRQGIETANLDPRHCPVLNEYPYTEDFIEEILKRMKSPERPTAIFAVNDTMALEIKKHLEDAGYRVPADVSIAGFDDDPPAAAATPPLTTVKVDRKQLGTVGAELMFRRLSKPDSPVSKMRLTTELVIRGSTGPAPKLASK